MNCPLYRDTQCGVTGEEQQNTKREAEQTGRIMAAMTW